jgi:hypothetical protein
VSYIFFCSRCESVAFGASKPKEKERRNRQT